MSSTGNVVLDTQIEHASSLLRQGRLEDAERAFARVLERVPDHVEGLNVLGMAALKRGETARAVELLRQAAARVSDGVTQTNLGHALDASGDLNAALDAYQAALSVNAGNFVALLHKARLLERQGQSALALPVYFKAITMAQAQGRWMDAQTTPPGILPLVRAAMRFINDGRRDLFGSLLEPLRQAYGRDALRRVEHCLSCYLGDARAESPDPRQKPTFLHFPGLPASPYLSRDLFPWIQDMEARTAEIRHELEPLLLGGEGRERVFHSETLERANLRSDRAAPDWNGYYFYRYGELKAGNAARCPRTQAAIDAAPLARIREHAPEVLFSVFSPGTHLLPHCGVTNTRVVAHLPLIVPEGCALSVGGEIHAWKEGRIVVFDDTYPHEAWNRSDSTRVVLIVDIWNPYLTEVERLAVAELVGGIGDFRKASEAASGPAAGGDL